MSNQRGAQLIHPSDLTAWVDHVSKHHGRTTEHIVLQSDSLVHRDIVLDLDPVSDACVGANHHVLTDSTILSDARISQHVGHMPDGCAFTDLHFVIDKGGGVDKIGCLRLDLRGFGGRSFASHGFLAALEHFQHAEPLVAVSARRLARPHTL